MKCIQCNTDNNLKDRTANRGRCKSCLHAFAFEPTSMRGEQFTDAFFAKVIVDISANNTLFFTPKQFLYLLEKRLKPKLEPVVEVLVLACWGCLYFLSYFLAIFIVGITLANWLGDIPVFMIVFNSIWIYCLFRSSNSQSSSYKYRQSEATTLQLLGVFILIAGVWYSLPKNSFVGYASAILLGLTSLWLGIWQKRKIARDRSTSSISIRAVQMQGWLEQWMRANGSVDKLLPMPQTLAASSMPRPDVTAYSFDRVVVCDSDAIANMLIANNFHFENNCAILAISGYPQNIFDVTMQMLRRNSELRVYALHNCDSNGVSLAHQLRSNPEWFPDTNIAIIDVGLLPRQIIAKPGVFIQTLTNAQVAQLPIEVRQGLSAAELKWLDAGNFVELESFTPQKLIQILQRSINTNREVELDDSGLMLGDSDTSIYAVDSFG
jgi:hypothetical protein